MGDILGGLGMAGASPQMAQMAPPTIPGLDPGPLVNLNTLPTLADVPMAQNVPQISSRMSPLQSIAQSLMNPKQQQQPLQAEKMEAAPTQIRPFNDSLLQQLLSSIGQNYLGRLGG
jgi:hypothetical protein